MSEPSSDVSRAFQAFRDSAPKHSAAWMALVLSALLIGLPAAGHGVTQVLPAALQAYDST